MKINKGTKVEVETAEPLIEAKTVRLIRDPITGESVDASDPDAVIGLFEMLDAVDKQVYQAKLSCREVLGEMARKADYKPDVRTRRVRGKKRRAMVELPAPTWDNSRLKEAWNAYPDFRDDYLRIGEIQPKLAEVKKLKSTAIVDNPPLEQFAKMVLGAEKAPTALPTVKVEV